MRRTRVSSSSFSSHFLFLLLLLLSFILCLCFTSAEGNSRHVGKKKASAQNHHHRHVRGPVDDDNDEEEEGKEEEHENESLKTTKSIEKKKIDSLDEVVTQSSTRGKRWLFDWLFAMLGASTQGPLVVATSLNVTTSHIFSKCNISLERDIPLAWKENSTFFQLSFDKFVENIRTLPFKVHQTQRSNFTTNPSAFRFFCPIFQVWLAWVNSLFLPLDCDNPSNSWCSSLNQTTRYNTADVSNIQNFHMKHKTLASTWPKWPKGWNWFTKPTATPAAKTTATPTTKSSPTTRPPPVYLPVCTPFYCANNPGADCNFPSDLATSTEVTDIPTSELISKGKCSIDPTCLIHCFRLQSSGLNLTNAHSVEDYLGLLSRLWSTQLKPYVELSDSFLKANQQLDTNSTKTNSTQRRDQFTTSSFNTLNRRKLFEKIADIQHKRELSQRDEDRKQRYYSPTPAPSRPGCRYAKGCDYCNSESNARACIERDTGMCCYCMNVSDSCWW